VKEKVRLVAGNCFSLLDKNIWKSYIHTDTKVCLYSSALWVRDIDHHQTTTKHLDAFDIWCLRKILRIPYTGHT